MKRGAAHDVESDAPAFRGKKTSGCDAWGKQSEGGVVKSVKPRNLFEMSIKAEEPALVFHGGCGKDEIWYGKRNPAAEQGGRNLPRPDPDRLRGLKPGECEEEFFDGGKILFAPASLKNLCQDDTCDGDAVRINESIYSAFLGRIRKVKEIDPY